MPRARRIAAFIRASISPAVSSRGEQLVLFMPLTPASDIAGLRSRVERLLRGEFRSDDLTRLFLFARDRTEGRDTVREIGDFVAHHDERTKGIITRATRDFFVVMHFLAQRVNQTISLNDLPAEFPDVLWAVMRRVNNKTIVSRTGIKLAQATKILPGLINKLIATSNGNFSITNHHTPKEIALIQGLIGLIIVQPAFDSDHLYDDFVSILKSQSILRKEEMRDFTQLKAAIALYAVSVMHNCNVILAHGSKAKLSASRSLEVERDGNLVHCLSVYATAAVRWPTDGIDHFSVPMFVTDLLPEDHCSPSLLSNFPTFDCELEVSSNSRLTDLS